MAEKLEFKNDIDVISVLRTRLLGYTTAPDGTTLLNAGNLTIKEVGEAILQDSGLREQIAQIIGVHADDVERIQEAIETLQGIDTDYGQRVADLEDGQATLNSALTALSEDTYRKAEVDEKVAEAKPSDYEAVKGRVTGLETSKADKSDTYTKAEIDTKEETISAECAERAKGIDDRLNWHDFRKVDRNATFVLDGDGEANLKQMMDSTEAYEQDAIMLSLEPIIPTSGSHNFGIRGQIACDDTYLYVCTAENTWKKIPLTNL